MQLLSTFRDPAGSLIAGENVFTRHIRRSHDAQLLEFLASPLAQDWTASGRLIASHIREIHSDAGEDETALVVEHPRIHFPSYPWEWPVALWRRAADFTLDLNSELIPCGWQLKDATPLNLLFQGVNPIFVDVLSVERRVPGFPLWMAYGQFVRTFLLPLLAAKQLGWPLEGTISRRDGYEPADLQPYLSYRRRLTQPARSLVSIPVLLERWFSKAAGNTARSCGIKQHDDVATAVQLSRMRSLRRRLRQVLPRNTDSFWSGYPGNAAHYSQSDQAQKQDFVENVLAAHSPKHVLDVGCNTGAYSLLAAKSGADVVAIDTDMAALEIAAAGAAAASACILPLHVNLCRPTPAAGWEYAESLSFIDRAEGRFDMVMALAVLHHFLLREQIPLDAVAGLFSRLTRRHAIVEWVPQADPMFQKLLRGRDALYAHLTESAFCEVFKHWFTFKETCRLSNGRTIFLLEKK